MNEQRRIEVEEVDEARQAAQGARRCDAPRAPARHVRAQARLSRGLPRAASRPRPAPVEPGGDLYEAVIEALKDIYDPEIPVNIYDLGLIYDVEITPDNHAMVTMTLTTPHCPVAESMPGEVELRVGAVPGRRRCRGRIWSGIRPGTRRR